MRRVTLFFLALALLFAFPAFSQNLTIGFTVSRTGSLNVDSMEQFRGFELWRDQTNAAGGIKAGGKAYKIQFVNYDDESNSKRVQQLYTRMILQDKADFLFSPYSSGLTATGAIITEQYGKIMITTGAADEKPYRLGNKYLYQMFAPAGQYLVPALDALKAKDPKAAVAIVYADDAFATPVATGAKAYAQKIGLNVVFNEAYAPSTADFSPIIDKVISAKATALLGGGHYADGATLARQLYGRKANLKFISLLVAPDSPQYTELGDAAVGVTVPSQWEPGVHVKPQFGPSVADFDKAYRAKYNTEPSYESAGGYAAGLILQHAIEQAGSTDTAKVADALNGMDVTTFYGRTKFAGGNEHGLQVGHSMVLAQWQKKAGKLEKQVVWPKDVQTAPLLYPIR